MPQNFFNFRFLDSGNPNLTKLRTITRQTRGGLSGAGIDVSLSLKRICDGHFGERSVD